MILNYYIMVKSESERARLESLLKEFPVPFLNATSADSYTSGHQKLETLREIEIDLFPELQQN